jgi:hypothetical protein
MRRSVVPLAQVSPTPVLCGASIVQALRKTALLGVLAVVASCGGPIRLGGDYADPSHSNSTLTHADLERVIAVATALGNGTADSRLHDVSEDRLDGYTVFTMASHVWTLDDGRRVMGWTSCQTRTIVVGTPPSGVWENSALVHELFHAFQGCDGILPCDAELDPTHANWTRDGLFAAILAARRE